ncbi:MAG: hypothetical protein ACYC1Z_01975 [Georgenia sp.]
MSNVVGYARVSTREQNPESQAARAWAEVASPPIDHAISERPRATLEGSYRHEPPPPYRARSGDPDCSAIQT